MKMFAIANTMQAAQGTCISVGIEADCRGCGVCVDSGDEFSDAVDEVIGDADGDKCGIDHRNMSGTLDPNFLNPYSKKCALQIRLLTVTSVRVLPMRSNQTCNSFWFFEGNLWKFQTFAISICLPVGLFWAAPNYAIVQHPLTISR